MVQKTIQATDIVKYGLKGTSVFFFHMLYTINKKMENFHPTGNCPVRDVLSRLGDKWSMLVLITLNANGVMRFSDIHKTIEDVSQRMLTVTLRTLEADGLVARKIYAEVPPRVEYCLTKTGHSLIPHIEALVGWALENMPVILKNRETKS